MIFFEKASARIDFEDLAGLQKHVSYPRAMQNDLRENVMKADPDRARMIINAVLTQKHNRENLTVETSIYLFMTLLADMRFVAFDSLDDERYLNRQRIVEKLLCCLTFREMRSLLDTFANEICLYMKKKKLRKRSALSERIADYIQEHFYLLGMDTHSLGRHFRLTPVYLSRTFRHQAGNELHNYISAVRVEQARNLMNENVKIKDVARMGGFGSVNSFIRVFRQKAGMTLGECRALL